MEKDKTVNFDKIWGGDFRVPTIVGEGSGKGFNFSNLHLPRGWENVVTALPVSTDKLQNLLNMYCQMFGLPTGRIEFYPENQVLKKISIRTEPISRLALVTDFQGMYQGENVRDLNIAIVLQRIAAEWMKSLWDEIAPDSSRHYSYIDGEPGRGFWSHNLSIPRVF